MTRSRSDAQLGAEAATPRHERKIVSFPTDERWRICGCRKCEARREELYRGA